MKRLTLRNIGQIKEADLYFGDLTVLVGPQASGKSISLQWLKLVADTGLIQRQMKTYGLDYDRNLPQFLDVYFGEGMQSIWCAESNVQIDGKDWNAEWHISRLQPEKLESVFFIPAQRVIALTNGWPRPFQSYSVGDPYTVRAFSEGLRLLMEREFTGSGPLFPKPNRLKKDYRNLLQQSIFLHDFNLAVDKVQSQKRLVLQSGGKPLPYMVWSAGQREFVPLLLGLYWLMPPSKAARRGEIEWVVIEELEMGLHPRAISVVLLLVLELMSRGYKVCLSTHSPQVLELVWALEALRKHKGSSDDLLSLFDAPHSSGLRQMAKTAIGKTSKVYYFDLAGTTQDITDLDPSSSEAQEASWGGLLEFSARANEAVAKAVANSPESVSGDLFAESQ
jgi:hypothetical protein